VRGPQLQVRDYIRRKERPQLKKFKNDDWNELEIIVKGGVVTTVVNGKKLTAQDMLDVSVKNGQPSAQLNGKSIDISKIEVSRGAVAKCYCNGEFLEDMPIPTKSAQGIGLQAETGKFEFRRIRIKEASSAP
jgi:3-keto-disaccharide hydrolase